MACWLAFTALSAAREPDWKPQRLAEIAKAEQSPSVAERVGKLGPMMRIAEGPMDAEQKEVFERARALLLGTPGVAEYYRQSIEMLRKSAEDPSRPDPDYDHYRGLVAFPAMARLPNAEIVAVLGGFLNDPEGRDKLAEAGDGGAPTINCLEAARSLQDLGIENPPAKASLVPTLAQADAWKAWWDEVAAGKRTYRFEGSPVEYGAAGPVNRVRPERRSPPAGNRPEEPRVPEDPPQTPKNASPPGGKPDASGGVKIGKGVIVLLILLALAAAFRGMRAR